MKTFHLKSQTSIFNLTSMCTLWIIIWVQVQWYTHVHHAFTHMHFQPTPWLTQLLINTQIQVFRLTVSSIGIYMESGIWRGWVRVHWGTERKYWEILKNMNWKRGCYKSRILSRWHWFDISAAFMHDLILKENKGVQKSAGRELEWEPDI